jgi:hypothetical protein
MENSAFLRRAYRLPATTANNVGSLRFIGSVPASGTAVNSGPEVGTWNAAEYCENRREHVSTIKRLSVPLKGTATGKIATMVVSGWAGGYAQRRAIR